MFLKPYIRFFFLIFPNLCFLINYFGISHHEPHHAHLPVLTRSPLPHESRPPNPRKKKKGGKKSIFMLSMYSLEHGNLEWQAPSREDELFSTYTPPETTTKESLAQGGAGSTQHSPRTLQAPAQTTDFSGNISTDINISPGPLTHSWFSAASWTRGFNMASLASRWPTKAAKPRHQSAAQTTYGSQASSWPGLAAWITDIINMAFSGMTVKRSQRRQENDKKYLWPRGTAESNLNHA